MSGALLDVAGLDVLAREGGRDVPVLEGFDLALEPGDAVGLVGESGSGKTSALLGALGLLPAGLRARWRPGGGTRFQGRDLARLSPRALSAVRGREIGFVFQEPGAALNPLLTVGEQVAEVLRRHLDASRRAARTRALELLEEVGLADAARIGASFPHQLSGGQNQRAALAIAVACDPPLVVADEPTSALDVTVQRELVDLFARLARERGAALLFTTHDLALVAALARRAVVLYAGRVAEEGSARALLARPAHPYTAALLAALPQRARPGERLAALPGAVEPPASRAPLGTACRFAPRCALAEERCRSAEPELRALGSGRAACHLAADPGRGEEAAP